MRFYPDLFGPRLGWLTIDLLMAGWIRHLDHHWTGSGSPHLAPGCSRPRIDRSRSDLQQLAQLVRASRTLERPGPDRFCAASARAAAAALRGFPHFAWASWISGHPLAGPRPEHPGRCPARVAGVPRLSPPRIPLIYDMQGIHRTVRRALSRPELTSQVLEVLAGRALYTLPYHQLLRSSSNPVEDWCARRFEPLARAELERHGLTVERYFEQLAA